MIPDLNLIIAKICHEANRAWCEENGDPSQKPWNEAAEWQQESAINGVRHVLLNPDSTPEETHANWLKDKQAAGWVYGPVKDADAKTHPCCVPYENLSREQRAKDAIFLAVVRGCIEVTRQIG